MVSLDGKRVCSKVPGNYYRIPGTCQGAAQFQISSLPGLDYYVKLDNGRRIVLNEVEMDEVTEEDEEAFRKRQEKDAEINRRAKERAEHMAEAREESKRSRQQQKLDEEQRRLDQQARDREKHNEEMRKKMAPIYGAQSLKEVR